MRFRTARTYSYVVSIESVPLFRTVTELKKYSTAIPGLQLPDKELVATNEYWSEKSRQPVREFVH